MPNPTVSDIHIQAALTDISVAYAQEQGLFVAERVAPVIPVAHQADKFFTYTKADWLRSDARKRAPGTESAGGGFRVSTDNYYSERVAVHMDVSDPERANADPAVNLDADATEYVTQQVLLAEEKDFVTIAMSSASGWDGASSSTNMTGQANPSSTTSNFRQWNDVASTPIEDIRGEITTVAKNTGRKPNTLVLGAQVWTALADHPDLLDRIKYTQTGVIGPELLASVLGLNKVEVMWITNDTSVEGSTASSYSFVAGKNALLAYVEQSPGPRKASALYCFKWTGPVGTPAQGVRIKRFRVEEKESDRVEGESWYVYKQVASGLGAMFAAAVA